MTSQESVLNNLPTLFEKDGALVVPQVSQLSQQRGGIHCYVNRWREALDSASRQERNRVLSRTRIVPKERKEKVEMETAKVLRGPTVSPEHALLWRLRISLISEQR